MRKHVRRTVVIASGILLLVGGLAGLLRLMRARTACASSVPRLVEGKSTGYAECSNGVAHRPVKQACPSLIPRADEIVSPRERREREAIARLPGYTKVMPRPGGCHFDRECTSQPHGYCTVTLPAITTKCVYGCVNDSDCGAGSICRCGDPVGRCVKASCSVDADCPMSFLCAEYSPSPGCFLMTDLPANRSGTSARASEDCRTDRTAAGRMAANLYPEAALFRLAHSVRDRRQLANPW
jgi:hypothetical protein